MTLFDDILTRLDKDGPIDIFISEVEYAELKEHIAPLWEAEAFYGNNQKLFLAFLRGYTFYKDVSENENAFWQSFHEELDIIQEPLKNTQYDIIWRCLGLYEETEALRIRDPNRRQFVKSIDTIWGITSFKASEVISAFIRYYREFPGKRLTTTIMAKILDFSDNSPDRQLENYYRVFKGMTDIVDYILEHDVDTFDIEALEAELGYADIKLGSPNALRYFANKSQTALESIITKLRLQRTPLQFKKYLKLVPLHRIVTPDGKEVLARNLQGEITLPYGKYIELDSEEDLIHHVVPDARISLNILEKLNKNTFCTVAGLEVFISTKTFIIKNADVVEHPQEIFFGGELNYIWTGKVEQGIPLLVNGDIHPRSIGSSYFIEPVFFYEEKPNIGLTIYFDMFQPNLGNTQLLIGDNIYDIEDISNNIISVDVTEDILQIAFESEILLEWQADNQLFTKSGFEIHNDLYTIDNQFWILGDKPNVSSNASLTLCLTKPTVWQIDWLDDSPLKINDFTLIKYNTDDIFKTTKPIAKKPRTDVHVNYHDDCFIADNPIEFSIPETLSEITHLKIENRYFPVRHGIVIIDNLSAGTYTPTLLSETYSVLAEPIYVIPTPILMFPNDLRFIEGMTYSTKLAIEDDGRFQSFRFKPFLNELAEPIPSSHEVEIDDGIIAKFDLLCDAFVIRVVDKRNNQVLEKLSNNQIPYIDIHPINNYSREFTLRASLNSDTETHLEFNAPYDFSQLNSLIPASRDRLVIEALIDGRTKDWKVIGSFLVEGRAILHDLSINNDILACHVDGCSDMQIRVEEITIFSKICNTYSLQPKQLNYIKLKRPNKMLDVAVKVYFVYEACSDEQFIKEFKLAPSFLDISKEMHRGVAWSWQNSESYRNSVKPTFPTPTLSMTDQIKNAVELKEIPLSEPIDVTAIETKIVQSQIPQDLDKRTSKNKLTPFESVKLNQREIIKEFKYVQSNSKWPFVDHSFKDSTFNIDYEVQLRSRFENAREVFYVMILCIDDYDTPVEIKKYMSLEEARHYCFYIFTIFHHNYSSHVKRHPKFQDTLQTIQFERKLGHRLAVFRCSYGLHESVNKYKPIIKFQLKPR